MKELDLYSEAKPRYYQLIPNWEDGLIKLLCRRPLIKTNQGRQV